MIAPDDMIDAFSWTRGPSRQLPQIRTHEFYESWEREQRDRWAVEALADAMERHRLEQGRREFFGVVSLILGVAVVCAALLFGAR